MRVVHGVRNRQEGLQTLLSRHKGRFGIDSQFSTTQPLGYFSADDTKLETFLANPSDLLVEGSFNKQHRNNRFKSKEAEFETTTTGGNEAVLEFTLLGQSVYVVSKGSLVYSSGAFRGDTITINGITFEIVSPTGTTSNIPLLSNISTNPTDTEFWNNVLAVLQANLPNYNVSYSIGTGQASFKIIAKQKGSSFNLSCTLDPTSQSTFKILLNTNGTDATTTTTKIEGSDFEPLYDNMFQATQMPATEYQYSWIITNTREEFHPTGSFQHTLRYGTENGLIRSGSNYVNVMNFPISASFVF